MNNKGDIIEKSMETYFGRITSENIQYIVDFFACTYRIRFDCIDISGKSAQ